MAAPTYFGAGAIATSAAGTSLTPALPASTAANDICLLIATSNGGAASPITWPGDYTEINQASVGGGLGGVAWKRLAGGDSDPTVTFAADGGGQHAVCSVYRGCITTGTPYEDEGNTGTMTSGTTETSEAVTTTGADRLVVCCGMIDDDTGFTTAPPPSGWALDTNVSTTIGADARLLTTSIVQASAGTVAATVQWTLTGAEFSRSVAFALLPDAGAAATSSIWAPYRQSSNLYSR